VEFFSSAKEDDSPQNEGKSRSWSQLLQMELRTRTSKVVEYTSLVVPSFLLHLRCMTLFCHTLVVCLLTCTTRVFSQTLFQRPFTTVSVFLGQKAPPDQCS